MSGKPQSNKNRAASSNSASQVVHWPRVKQILDGAIDGWKAANGGREPRLKPIHGASFGWSTKAELLAATAKGFRLIDPALVASKQGDQTNLVKALRDPDGVDGNGQMPDGGPFLSVDEINEIISWINGGTID